MGIEIESFTFIIHVDIDGQVSCQLGLIPVNILSLKALGPIPNKRRKTRAGELKPK